MGKIGKVGNLDIENYLQYLTIKKSCISSFKISPFRMKKFEINELIRYKTFFQRSDFEMSHFDIIKAKNLVQASFNTKKSRYSSF